MPSEPHELIIAPPAEKPERLLGGTPTIRRAKAKFIYHLRASGDLKQAAEEIGYDTTAVHAWRKADPAFSESVNQTLMALRAEHLPQIEANIFHLAKLPDPRLANFALKVAERLDESWAAKKPEQPALAPEQRQALNEWMAGPETDILEAEWKEVE